MNKFLNSKSASSFRAAVLLAAVLLIFSVPFFARAADWWPIVPCGLQQQPSGSGMLAITLKDPSGKIWDYTKPCNQCDLILLFKNMIDLVEYWVVPAVGTLMFIVGGFFILLGGARGDPKTVARGRTIMKDAAIGIAIILASWLIANTILKSLAGNQDLANKWYKIDCVPGSLESQVNAVIPHPDTGSQGPYCNPVSGTCSNSPSTSCQHDSDCQTITSSGTQCAQSNLNFCQGAAPQGCANSSCSQYSGMAERQATGAATANVLKAFMEVESSCNINPPNSGAGSYGLMQLKPPIPQIYGTRCGLSSSQVSSINQSWLTNPANAEKSICIAAQFINAIAQSQCGSSIGNLYAGYNGGPNAGGACSPSNDCSGTVCGNTPPQAWECLYDNAAHTVCNSGYNQTRQGAARAIACSANPGF